jgi:hypothetical protein
MFLGFLDTDPDLILLSSSKNRKKNLDTFCFATSFCPFLSLKNNVNVPWKNNKQIFLLIFCCLVSWRSMTKITRSRSESISQRHRSPDPHQKVMDLQHWYVEFVGQHRTFPVYFTTVTLWYGSESTDPYLWLTGPILLFLSVAFKIPTKQNFFLVFLLITRVSDPDPDWIRIQSGQWIRIRIRNPDSDPGGQKWPTKVEKIHVLKCWMASFVSCRLLL